MDNKYLFVINKEDQSSETVYEQVLKTHREFVKSGFSPFFSQCPDDYLFTYQFVPNSMQVTGAYYACDLAFRKVEKNGKKYINLMFQNVNGPTPLRCADQHVVNIKPERL